MRAEVAPLELSHTGPDSELVVGGYRVERLLRRRSATDAVYEGIDLEHGRRVELRVVAQRDHARRRGFEAEATLLQAVRHPHLPEVYESGEDTNVLFVATAFLEGMTLAEMSARGGLPPMRAVRVLGAVADALDAVHGAGLVHGDVRLQSVIVVERQTEHPYLVDFVLGGPKADGSPPAATAAADVRALAVALREVCPDIPPALDEVLGEATSSHAPRRTAGELLGDAARAVMAAPQRPVTVAPRRQALPVLAPDAAPAPVKRRRPLAALASWRIPALGGVLAVLVAAAAGFLIGAPPAGEDSPGTASSVEGVRISLPPGWQSASAIPPFRGLELEGGVAASAPGGRTALVAGRLRGLEGSVYPGAVAESIDPKAGTPRAVRLDRYEALRVEGVHARGGGELSLFVAPTSDGTLVAACLAGAPAADCEGAVASLELSGASASGFMEGERFAARLARILRRLDRGRSAHARSLRAAATSRGQAKAARELAGDHRTAAKSVAGLRAPPAAKMAQERLGASLRAIKRSYSRLATAARSRNRRAYGRAERSLRREEATLGALLRRL
jgi:tRNA A-37 threonylcarbamoyl transferase component Bud32